MAPGASLPPGLLLPEYATLLFVSGPLPRLMSRVRVPSPAPPCVYAVLRVICLQKMAKWERNWETVHPFLRKFMTSFEWFSADQWVCESGVLRKSFRIKREQELKNRAWNRRTSDPNERVFLGISFVRPIQVRLRRLIVPNNMLCFPVILIWNLQSDNLLTDLTRSFCGK